ncbi:hypothetical protein H5410_008794 [Solanum commersonii]|uniref:Uncharacterized protein n=1 Tax=Solanum commersonii TaxID=4109 RepID=A0A9J6AG73_SOLCO|nr:hypothetical protein H5410_008794 [Solanum commersonii]
MYYGNALPGVKIPRLASIWWCITELNNSMLPSFFLKFKEREAALTVSKLCRDKDHGYKYYQLCRDKYFYCATGSPVFSHLSKISQKLLPGPSNFEDVVGEHFSIWFLFDGNA